LYADFPFLAPVFGAVLGLLLGSFLNVCIYRVPRDLSVVFPRSHCPACGVQIRAADNIPILSYLLLRGRCRSCGSPIGWRYPAVEFTAAVLLAGVLGRYGWSVASLKWSVFECLMIVLFWTDLEERILPREFTFGGAILGLIFCWFVPLRADLIQLFFSSLSIRWISLADAVIGALFFAGLFWAAAAVWSRMAGREAMGQGDVHLLLLLGAFLGFEQEVPALTIGAVTGSVIGAAYVLFTHRQMRSFELPLGSFLCAGAAAVPLFWSAS
jgi:leader peptidase (prepilin peptidase)/N-methyltransferase